MEREDLSPRGGINEITKRNKEILSSLCKICIRNLIRRKYKNISVVQYIDMLDCLEDIIDDDNEMIEVLEDYFNQEDNEE